MNLTELKRKLQPGDILTLQIVADVTNKAGNRTDRYIFSAEPYIGSTPPKGQFRVVNFYVDAITKKLVVEYDDTPVDGEN